MEEDWDNPNNGWVAPKYDHYEPEPRQNGHFETSYESKPRNDFNHRQGQGRGRGRGFGNFQNSNREFRRENTNPSKNLYVPTRMVGKLIGRGGSKISELQSTSGARINVTKTTQDDNTLVTIQGNDSQISQAEQLIEEVTKDAPLRFVEPQVNKGSSGASFYQGLGDDIDYAKLSEQWKKDDIEYERLNKEKWEKIGAIIKNFYAELPDVADMSPEEVAEFRESKNNIVVKRTFENEGGTGPIPNPVKTFYQAFHNYPDILGEIEKAGFEEPSPIQCQAWPVIMSGEDMIGIAQTGTGKTLAFLLPALIHIDGQTRPRHERRGPSVLVFAPTRELALQIEKECKKYFYKDIKAVCVYGGGNKREQIEAIEDGAEIVIATPGRFNDLYMADKLPLDYITYVVLDEADRMLDMGFEPQIRKILFAIRPDRQTIMTSATWPNAVRDLAKSYMVNPIQVYVGSLDLAATHTVTQSILILDDEDHKFQTFVEFAQSLKEHEKVICFVGKKSKADYISSELTMMNIFGATMHGSLDQCDREQALKDIADGTVQILIATDLASRGLDIEDITHVVNYDFPRNIEEYVHRVGRTGRAGRCGDSISYITRQDWGSVKELIPILEEANQMVPEELHEMAKRFEARKMRNDGRGGRGGRGRRW